MEARRIAGLNSAPPCFWSPSPPLELKEAPTKALSANSGFVTFGSVRKTKYELFFFFTGNFLRITNLFLPTVIYPRHVEGRKLDRTVWSLLTFHAYVSYHVKVINILSA